MQTKWHHQKKSLNPRLIWAIIGFIIFFSCLSFIQVKENLFDNPVPVTTFSETTNLEHSSPSPTSATTTAVLAETKKSTPSAQPLSTTSPLKQSKKIYSIALIGDSMVDTMGENTDYLQKSLSTRYPTTEFKLYNYGIGGENVEQGLNRVNKPFNYKTRNYPPLPELKPDILIIGSFSYNPFPQHDVARHNRLLQSLINQGRGITPKIYLLAEIAPLKDGFGEGPGGVNWPKDKAAEHSLHITEQLDDTVKLAKTENIPLINTYQTSKVNGNYGNKAYVNSHDGIHPSPEGHIFMADIIANFLKF